MIDFEEELKKFQPSLEVEEAEEAIYNQDLTDMTDILKEMLKDMKGTVKWNVIDAEQRLAENPFVQAVAQM